MFGFSFLAVSVDHQSQNFLIKIKALLTLRMNVQKQEQPRSIALGEKIGFKTNLVAINPFNPNQKVPVYFANFVLMDYGFGAFWLPCT